MARKYIKKQEYAYIKTNFIAKLTKVNPPFNRKAIYMSLNHYGLGDSQIAKMTDVSAYTVWNSFTVSANKKSEQDYDVVVKMLDDMGFGDYIKKYV